MKPALEAYTSALALSFAWSANSHIAGYHSSGSPTRVVPEKVRREGVRRIPTSTIQPKETK